MRENIIKNGQMAQLTQYQLVKQRFFRNQCLRLKQKLSSCHKLQSAIKKILIDTMIKQNSTKQFNIMEQLDKVSEQLKLMSVTIKEENNFFSNQIYYHKQEEKNQYIANKQIMRSYEQMKAQIRFKLTQVQNRIRNVEELPFHMQKQNLLTVLLNKQTIKNKMEQKLALYEQIFQRMKSNKYLTNKIKQFQLNKQPYNSHIETKTKSKLKQTLKEQYEKSASINRKQQSLRFMLFIERLKRIQERKKIQRKCEILQQAKLGLQKDFQIVKLREKIFVINRASKEDCIVYLKFIKEKLDQKFKSDLYFSFRRRSRSCHIKIIRQFDQDSQQSYQAESQTVQQKPYEVTQSFLAHLKYLNASKSVIVSQKFIADAPQLQKTDSEYLESFLSRKEKTLEDSFQHQEIISRRLSKF